MKLSCVIPFLLLAAPVAADAPVPAREDVCTAPSDRTFAFSDGVSDIGPVTGTGAAARIGRRVHVRCAFARDARVPLGFGAAVTFGVRCPRGYDAVIPGFSLDDYGTVLIPRLAAMMMLTDEDGREAATFTFVPTQAPTLNRDVMVSLLCTKAP